MKIENATLKESLESMEHLTSAICRLRLSLLKVIVLQSHQREFNIPEMEFLNISGYNGHSG